MNKKTVFILSLLITFVLIGNVLAITASIGNARMILRAEIGDKIEKYILVKNVNDVAVNIVLTASGDLEDYITIQNANFSLGPGEDKKAFFTIEVEKEGTTETKINVQFTPVGEKNGAGLSSTIIIIADGTNLDEDTDEINTDENTDAESDTDSSIKSGPGNITGNIVGMDKKYMAALIITGIMFIIFIVVLITYYSRFKKKSEKSENIAIKKTKLKKRVKRRA